MVARFGSHLRLDDIFECSGPDRTRGHPIQPSSREHDHRVYGGPWSPAAAAVSLGGNRDSISIMLRRTLSFRAELKRSEMAMEYPRRGCRSYIVGCFYTDTSGVPATLQFISEDLRRTESSGNASAVALSD